MAFTKVANAVVAIPLATGKKRYITIGSMLETDQNDPSKGLPYLLMLDPWISLESLAKYSGAEGASLPVSFYTVKNADYPPREQERRPQAIARKHAPGFDLSDDDLPF